MISSEDILRVRRALNFTQAHFAMLLGVHALTVSKWERDLLTPNPHQVALIESFDEATKRKPEIGAFVIGALVGAGVVAALYKLFHVVEEGGTSAPAARASTEEE